MKKSLEKIDYSNYDNKHKMNKLFEELLCSVKKNDEELYDYAKMEVYIMANGKVLTQEMAKCWVEDMKPIGEHWTMEETTAVMQNMGYNFDKAEFYAIMNNMYNDNYDLVKDDTDLCCKLSYNWLSDIDAKKGKTFNYWYYVTKRD